ncbi:hypothetical protein [Catellatospora tritici]|uniref:hypothetical protein n=1 Tax=Catellatospora tritici TaxID=2851566 RepID=UPI001C2D9AEB|nr:hypothetical protein [Catellatospora tritici]MBV1853439.1 hypothetical protein [Catellatospora tritici]
MLSRIPLRPRTVVALGLAIVVVFIVTIGKLLGGTTTPLTSAPPAPHSTIDPDEGDDGVVKVEASLSPLKPSSGPEAATLATSFAKNWIRHDRDAAAWLKALRPMCTEALTAELDGVDPAGVPASRITGPAIVDAFAETYVEVSIPIDAGTLRLRMIASAGTWLVDGIDWERA